jgi:hypothetical protein
MKFVSARRFVDFPCQVAIEPRDASRKIVWHALNALGRKDVKLRRVEFESLFGREGRQELSVSGMERRLGSGIYTRR